MRLQSKDKTAEAVLTFFLFLKLTCLLVVAAHASVIAPTSFPNPPAVLPAQERQLWFL